MAASEDSQSSQPPTFEDLGIPRSNAQPVNTVLGQRRKWNSLTVLEVVFLVVASLSILSAMGLTIERIVYLIQHGQQDSDDFTFALVLIISTGFCLFYIWNGVFGERAFELLVFVAGVIILLGYCILNYAVYATSGKKDPESLTIKLVRLILVAVLGPIDILMGCFLARQYFLSGNLIFRTVGANIVLQKLCRNMNVFESLLKFDLQLQITLVVLILSGNVSNREILAISIGVPYSIIYSILGWLAVRFENKVMSVVFLVASIAEPAYIIYKIVDVSDSWSQDHLLIQVTIIIASWVGLGIRIVLLVVFVRAYRNFGKGLKEKVVYPFSGDFQLYWSVVIFITAIILLSTRLSPAFVGIAYGSRSSEPNTRNRGRDGYQPID